jgi:NADPH-dependent 2,4-dienoyl-CoA reductase/sulfur reductase-like enzyme
MKQLSDLDDLNAVYDVAVVGGGPSGMAAAATAAAHDLDVIVLDDNPDVGGQIYKGLRTSPVDRRRILGATYTKGDELIREFTRSSATYLPGAAVWMASRSLELGVSKAGRSRIIRARRIILATGAFERPFPIPGWTLPGVLTVGAAQGLLKVSGVAPLGRFVLAGTGPLLWLLASQLLSGGHAPVAILDTARLSHQLRASAALPAFVMSEYFPAAIKLIRHVTANIPIIRGVTMLAAEGQASVSRVTYRRAGRPLESIDVEHLLLHQGVVPNFQLPSAAGCAIQWNESHACWQPVIDLWGETSIDSIAIAGDGGAIRGAESASRSGRLCGLDAAFKLGRIEAAQRDTAAAPIRRELTRFARGRSFIDAAFLPDRDFRVASADTLVCRCEEIRGGQVTELLNTHGAIGPNQLKSFLRCGMGPCQGRQCGLTVTEMIAAHRGVSPAAVGSYRLRFPVKPISLAEFASLPQEPSDVRAVVRL